MRSLLVKLIWACIGAIALASAVIVLAKIDAVASHPLLVLPIAAGVILALAIAIIDGRIITWVARLPFLTGFGMVLGAFGGVIHFVSQNLIFLDIGAPTESVDGAWDQPGSTAPNLPPDPSSDNSQFPFYSFPRPSDYVSIPAQVVLPSAASYADVAEFVEEKAQESGYPGLRYYSLYMNSIDYSGLVMIADLERIDDEGQRVSIRPFEIDYVAFMPHMDWREYFRYLFTAPPGRYRFIIILLSDHMPFIGSSSISRDTAQFLISRGDAFVGERAQDIDVSDNTKLHFLIYEFVKPPQDEAKQLGEGRLLAEKHLQSSGLAARLNMLRAGVK